MSSFFSWYHGEHDMEEDWETRISRYVATTPCGVVEIILGELRRIESRLSMNIRKMVRADARRDDDRENELCYKEWISSLANFMEIELVMRLTAQSCRTAHGQATQRADMPSVLQAAETTGEICAEDAEPARPVMHGDDAWLSRIKHRIRGPRMRMADDMPR